jgi:hypothetical protein
MTSEFYNTRHIGLNYMTRNLRDCMLETVEYEVKRPARCNPVGYRLTDYSLFAYTASNS